MSQTSERRRVVGVVRNPPYSRLGAVDVCTERKSEGMQIDLMWGPIAAAVMKNTPGNWSRGMRRPGPTMLLPTHKVYGIDEAWRVALVSKGTPAPGRTLNTSWVSVCPIPRWTLMWLRTRSRSSSGLATATCTR